MVLGSIPSPATIFFHGEIPERLKGADCKSAVVMATVVQIHLSPPSAGVAQMVEHLTEDQSVGGPIPSSGTNLLRGK